MQPYFFIRLHGPLLDNEMFQLSHRNIRRVQMCILTCASSGSWRVHAQSIYMPATYTEPSPPPLPVRKAGKVGELCIRSPLDYFSPLMVCFLAFILWIWYCLNVPLFHYSCMDMILSLCISLFRSQHLH